MRIRTVCSVGGIAMLLASSTATATAAGTDAAPVVVTVTETTAVALRTPMSFDRVAAAVRRLGAEPVAAFHDGDSRGVYRSAPADAAIFFKRYSTLLRALPTAERVVGVVIRGSRSVADLTAAGLPVRVVRVLPADVTAHVYGAAAEQPILAVGESAPAGTSDAADAESTVPPGDWAPMFGKVDTYSSGDRRVIRQEMTWTQQANIDAFGESWAYEHDFKLFADDAGTVIGRRPFCVGPGADDFWADRDAGNEELLDTNLPASASAYLDTQAQDDCAVQDYTVGIFNPTFLVAGEHYWTSITTGGGDADSTPAQLSAAAMPKNCPVAWTWCVDPVPVDDREGVGLAAPLVNDSTYSAPGCREWHVAEANQECAFFDNFDRSDGFLSGNQGWEPSSVIEHGEFTIDSFKAVPGIAGDPAYGAFDVAAAAAVERTMTPRNGVMDIEVTLSDPDVTTSDAALVIGKNAEFSQGVVLNVWSYGWARLMYATPNGPGLGYHTDVLYEGVATPSWEPGTATVRLSYDSIGQARFYFDGSLLASFPVPAGLPMERVALIANKAGTGEGITFDDFRQY